MGGTFLESWAHITVPPPPLLTHARTAFAVQVVQAAETFLAARTVGQVAFARLRDHALGHDGRAHGLVARVTDDRERDQRTDDGDEQDVLHHSPEDARAGDLRDESETRQTSPGILFAAPCPRRHDFPVFSAVVPYIGPSNR